MTRGEIKTAIQALGYGTDTDIEQNEGIKAAVRRVSGMKRWPWQEAQTTSAAIALGASVVTGLPADLLHVDALRITSGSQASDLDWTDRTTIQQHIDLDVTNGTPYEWNYSGTTLSVYPRANKVYAVDIDYVATVTLPTSDASVLPGPDTYHDLYKWLATAHMAFNERDWNAYNACNQQAVSALAELNAEIGVRQRQSSRQVTRTGRYRAGAFLGPGAF